MLRDPWGLFTPHEQVVAQLRTVFYDVFGDEADSSIGMMVCANALSEEGRRYEKRDGRKGST
jgi:hypothetical protein